MMNLQHRLAPHSHSRCHLVSQQASLHRRQKHTAYSSFKCSISTAAAGPPAAVITGCSTGIGKETALLLAQKGWQVFAGARSAADLQQLGQLHQGITPVQLDVTSQESVDAACKLVQAAVGDQGLQLLMNNAGIGMVAPVEFFDLKAFRDVLEVNFMGAVTTSQAFVPLLRQGQHKGRIINISSVAGHLNMPLWTAYCSTKHALESFSDCLRFELEPFGVPVVIIKPGPVVTPIWQKSRAKSTVQVDPQRFAASREVYGTMMAAMDDFSKQSVETAISVDEVVRVIYEAATAPQPKSRYHVGKGAAMTYWAKRLLPDWVWQAALSRTFSKAYEQVEQDRLGTPAARSEVQKAG